jgi:hypothetical protein
VTDPIDRSILPLRRPAFVDGEPVGGGRMDQTVPFRFSGYAGTEDARAEVHERMQHAALAHGIGA